VRLVYDAMAIQSRNHGERGIARYVQRLAVALERLDADLVTDYLLDPRLPIPATAEPLVRSGKVVRTPDVPIEHRLGGGVYQIGSPMEEVERSDQLLPSWARHPRWRLVTILYDLIPARFPELYLRDRTSRIVYEGRLELLRHAEHHLAISEATKADAVELLGLDPGRVTVIWAGTDPRFEPPRGSRAAAAGALAASGLVPGLRPPFVLFTGGADPRKNTDGLLAAYALLPEALRARHQLVIVGQFNESDRRMLDDRFAALGIGDDVLVTGFVSDDTVVALNQSAHVVVFPSRYEGFGLPVLEARQAGAPVICGDNSSLREVMPDPSGRFDADDPASIASALHRVLESEPHRRALAELAIDEEHRWEAAARRTAEVYRELLARPARGAVRPRLAVAAGPLPAGAPRTDYVLRLAGELARRVDVTVLLADDHDADDHDADDALGPLVPAGVELARQGELLRPAGTASRFDEVLYVVDGTAEQAELLACLEARPGPVLLRSLDLLPLFEATFTEAPEWSRELRYLLERNYPARYPPNVLDQFRLAPEDAQRYGVLVVGELQHRATRLLSHSTYVAHLVELDTGRRCAVVGPEPVPEPRRSSPSGDPSHPVLAVLAPDPGGSLLAVVLDLLRERWPTIEIRMAAPSPGRSDDECAPSGGEARPGSLPAIRSALDGADVALMLGSFTRGEAPHLASEAIAAGVPLAALDIGTAGDLPDSAILRLPADASGTSVAETVARLLQDPSRRTELGRNATAHATKATYAAAAESVLGIVLPKGVTGRATRR
jgi:glycosyltransferase involved in cell wall biosynthesis